MSIKIVMPQLGESVHEGTVGRWLKQEGDPVREFEPILEITTDKVDTEVTAASDGVLLKIEAPTGATVNVGGVLGWIGRPEDGGNGHSTPPPAAATPDPQPPTADLGFISPVVAKLAAEHKLNLARIKGTGLGGRITKKDVLAYIEAQSADNAVEAVTPTAAVRPAPVSAAASRASVNNQLPISNNQTPPLAAAAGDRVLPLSSMRRAIAEHMMRSKQAAPHVTTVFDADLSRLSAHRENTKAIFARDGVKLTFTAYFVSAIAAALKAFPAVNSVFAEDQLILKHEINIGVAVSLGDEGLIVPVIKNADDKSLLGLARTVNDLAARARAKQLKPDEVQGGTFTLTNHGTSGSLFATPIINQPQCGILGVGVIEKRVVVINDAIAIRSMCYISLTFDHRILDGATADYFVAKVKDVLETWPQS